MAKRCPLCDFVANDDAGWRRHLREEHDWDPSGEPTWAGDALVAIGLGFVVFLAVMMSSLCSTGAYGPGGCEKLGPWFLAGIVSFVAGVFVVIVQPLRQLGRRRWVARGGARAVHRDSRLSSSARERLVLIEATASRVMAASFLGFSAALFIMRSDEERSTLWLMVVSACLLTLGISAFVRARMRARLS